MAEQPVRSTLSERVQAWADGDRIKNMLDAIEGLEKKVWVNCPHCKKKSLVDVPDDVRKLEALLKVIEQTEGKPGTVDGEPGGVTIIIERSPKVALNGDDTNSTQLRPPPPTRGVSQESG